VRLLSNGQAIHEERGKYVSELVLPDRSPADAPDGRGSSDSRMSISLRKLNGGERLIIGFETGIAQREVVTQAARVYTHKTIRHSDAALYNAVARGVLTTI
jgi:hypothetical protein